MDRPYRLLPLLAAAGLVIAPHPAAGARQDPGGGPAGHRPPRAQEATAASRAGDPLAALIAEALERNPRLAAARASADAAEERTSQAGAWEDPVLTFGFINLRTTSFDFSDDFMTMKVVQLGQRLPLPGQLGHRRGAAERLAASAAHRARGVRTEVAAEVKEAYAELYYRDRALEITERNLSLLRGLEEFTRVRYVVGSARQPALLRTGLETDALEARRVALAESRRSTLARLNALRSRPPDVPVEETPYPAALRRLADGRARAATSRFVDPLELGGDPSLSPAGDPTWAGGFQVPGLPPLDSLIERALEAKPDLRAHVARIEAREREVRRARADRWPAPSLMLGYGQRDGHPDMMDATLSFSLPIFAGAKQNAAVREAEAVLAEHRAIHGTMVDEIRREVTQAYSRLADALGQLEIFGAGILARAEANLEASVAGYRSGVEDFLVLLDSQAALYRTELEYHRRLADLLSGWAELERAVGEEIEP